jgi:hypothetical protein
MAFTVYGSRWGYGTIFELSPPPAPAMSWTERVIYTFGGGLDGTGSAFGLTIDSAGNLFGGGTDGAVPESGMLLMSGESYGTTPFGGHHVFAACYDNHCGTIYEVNP